jgi:hypothetical protein
MATDLAAATSFRWDTRWTGKRSISTLMAARYPRQSSPETVPGRGRTTAADEETSELVQTELKP